jgi:hypothetical protein
MSNNNGSPAQEYYRKINDHDIFGIPEYCKGGKYWRPFEYTYEYNGREESKRIEGLSSKDISDIPTVTHISDVIRVSYNDEEMEFASLKELDKWLKQIKPKLFW